MIKQLGVTSAYFARHPVCRRELLEAYPTAKLYEGARPLDEQGMIDFLKGCDAAIVGLDPITDRVLTEVPELRVIGKFGIGCETIDFDALRKHKVRFGYTGGVNRLPVAELTLCFMIFGLRSLMSLNTAMRAGERPRGMNSSGRLLTGRTIGIHGCGNVGKEVVRLLQPFDCEILVHDIADYPDFYRKYGVKPVSFETLLERSEIVTMHVPLTAATAKIYDAKTLAKLRPDCVLINTARGGLVDEEALMSQLEAGKLAAACFDVFAIEPAANDRLLRLPNFLATPHIGASIEEIRVAMGRAAIRGLTENEFVEPGRYF